MKLDSFYPYPKPYRISIPNSYTLFKNKNLRKLRPITSYSSHPYSRVFNAAARALNFILDNAVVSHLNLPKICDFKEKINEMNGKLSTVNYNYLSMTGDLANMYTSLDHSSIRKAVRWLLFDTSKTVRERKCVSVPVSSNDNNTTFGKSMASDNSKITLTYDELIDIMNFDLNNSVFTVGNTTKQQKCGIPMGSPLSPALAVIVCAYYEHLIFEKLRSYKFSTWTNKVLGVRYMDDVFSVVTHDGTNVSKHRAKEILKWFEFGYHKNMTLECEDTSIPLKFLSSTMTAVDGSPITYEYYNKNIDSIISTSTQKFLTFQHYGSLAPKAQKRSVIVSSLHRLCMNSNSKSDFEKASIDLHTELTLLKYPDKIFRDALLRVYAHDRYINLPGTPNDILIPDVSFPIDDTPNDTPIPEVPPPVNENVYIPAEMDNDLSALERQSSRTFLTMFANFGNFRASDNPT